jgi:hypothetical protein
LADVAVEPRDAGDVDDAAILGVLARLRLDAHKRRCCTDETEGRADVDFHDDVPCVVRHRVQHAVIGKTSFLTGERLSCAPEKKLERTPPKRTIIDDVVQLAVPPGKEKRGLKVRRAVRKRSR